METTFLNGNLVLTRLGIRETGFHGKGENADW